jgi:signal transduction histidine kinase/tetratricopeptide (TPR) repeat protein
MKFKPIILLSILFFASAFWLKAETINTDSLKNILNQKQLADTTKIKASKLLASKYITSNLDSAKNYLDLSLKYSVNSNNKKEEADSYRLLSSYYYIKRNIDESFTFIVKALELYNQLNDEKGKAVVLNNYGLLFKNYGKYDEALEKFYEALILSEKHSLLDNTSNTLNNIGTIKSNTGENEEAISVFKKALEIEKVNKNKSNIASIYTNLAIVYQYKDENDTALYYHHKSFELFKELEDLPKLVGCLNNIANIHRVRAEYTKALKAFNLAIEYAEKSENTRLKAISLINMGIIYLNIKDYDKALVIFEESSELLKNIDLNSYAASLSNLSIVYEEKGRKEEALKILDEALDIYLSQKSFNNIISTNNNIASIHLIDKNYEKASFYYNKAKEHNVGNMSKFGAIYTYLGLSKLDTAQSNLNSAEKNALVSYNLAKEISAILEQSESSKLLSSIYKSQKKYKEAIEYFEVYKNLSDSITDSEKNRELGRVEAEAEYKRLEETLMLENKNKILEKEVELTNQKYYVMILSISFFALIIVIILLLRLKKNKEKINAILLDKQLKTEDTNKELQELHLQKNKLFSIIAHDLRGPLNTLSWFFNMAIEGKLSQEEINALLPEVNKNVVNTTLLTENLLNWASKSMNEYSKEKQAVNLYENLEDKKELFSTPLKNKGLEFINNVNPDTQIYIDKHALELILRNLISNAIKFCKAGDKIEVFSTIENGFSKICIKDTGVGMNEIQSKKLFNSEGVSSLKGTNDETGSGIGLMLCKSFIVENGGSIWVEKSEVGKGTTICFKIPLNENI